MGVAGLAVIADFFWWWYRFRDGEITRLGMRRGHSRVRRLLDRHEANPVSQASEMAKDLIEFEECLSTFARVDGVDPTNNEAERTIRKAVLWRTCSFGSASRGGSLVVERMLTVCESLRAQGRSMLDFLVAALRAHGDRTASPSLLPVAV